MNLSSTAEQLVVASSRRGGSLGTAPFHWAGDMRDIGHLTSDSRACS